MVIDVDIRRTLAGPHRPFSLDVRFRSEYGRIVLYGPSGSGKSLTLRAIAGLITPDQGRIVVHGQTWFHTVQRICLPAPARRVGYLFQDYALFPHLTVGQNVAFGLGAGWRNPSRRSLPDAARHWLAEFELDDEYLKRLQQVLEMRRDPADLRRRATRDRGRKARKAST